MTHAIKDLLRERLANRTPLPIPDILPEGSRIETGVLALISATPTPMITMIVRASQLQEHAGEVAFPGGKREPHDADLAATAIREANEELGLLPSQVDIVGRLSPVPVATSRYRIHPFVGWIERKPDWQPSGEIGRVLDLSLASFAQGDIPYHEVEVEWAGQRIQSPFFIIDEATRLYGASAFVFVELMSIVGPLWGRVLPAPRVVSSRGGVVPIPRKG